MPHPCLRINIPANFTELDTRVIMFNGVFLWWYFRNINQRRNGWEREFGHASNEEIFQTRKTVCAFNFLRIWFTVNNILNAKK